MATKPPKALNLLESTATPKSTWDKIYDWVFTVGRYVIVAVEVVVLVAFASRFVLDRKNNDLKDAIAAKLEILKSQREMEQEIRGVQRSLTNISNMVDNQPFMAAKLADLLDTIPQDVVVSTMTVNLESANIACTAPDYESVNELEEELRADPKYKDVSVSLSKSGAEGSQVEFSLSLNFAEE